MVEIHLYEDDKKSIANHNQEPFRVMIAPALDIDIEGYAWLKTKHIPNSLP